MKMFILTAETEYEGGSPVLVIPAQSRKSALKKINARENTVRRSGFSNLTVVTIPEEVRAKNGLPSADEYALYEVPLLSN